MLCLGRGGRSVERCGHPKWPGVTVAVGRGEIAGVATVAERAVAASAAIVAKVVRAGDTVRFWSQETNVRMEMAAVCDEAGAAGDRIRVRGDDAPGVRG